jgi:hypothetical protein
MAELKTQRTGANVGTFIDAIPDEAVRQDRIQLDVLKVMAAASLRYLRETEAST